MVGVNLEAGRRHGAVKSNEDSFETLFAAEYARVAGIANRVLADPHEAEDVAQEVFIDFNRLHSAAAPYAAAWLYRAAAHKALNRVRGRRLSGSRWRVCGACVMSWYDGTGKTPNVNTGNIASGTTYVTLLSTSAPNFTGYMFALCNFQFAHGYAAIRDRKSVV